jgi:putative ABC transport system permease protein
MRWEYVGFGLDNLLHRKLRSFLTVLSILIGIAAIFALVSFGFGIQGYVDEIAQEAGVDKLFIQARGTGAPGADDTFRVTKDDVEFTEKINGVAEASGVYIKPIDVTRNKKTKYVYGYGYAVDDARLVEQSFTVKVEKGRNFRKGDDDKIIIGYNYQIENKVFEKPVLLGEKLEILGKKFEVIGFWKSLGNPVDDASVYFTDEGFESLFPESKDSYGFIIVRAEKNVKADVLDDLIEERLRKHKNQEKGKEDFFVQTFEDILQTFTNVVGVLNGMLFLIALISVVVASVNTMNTMYTAVIERTKEIGVMKAIGARNEDIMFIFIFEAGFMGMVGGVAGVLLGWIIASIGGAIAAASGFGSLQPVFPLPLVVGCIVFAFLVGAISGILPARQASQLKPIDALRYE